MIKEVAFNVDGMIFVGPVFSEQLATDYGISPQTTRPFFQGVFKKCLIGQADLKEELSKVIRPWGWKKSVEELVDYWFKDCGHVDQRVLDEANILRSRGVKCSLATNQEKYRADYLLNELRFGQYFDRVFVSYDLGCKKPDPEFFEKVVKGVGEIKPEEVLWWDKSENAQVAKAFGFQEEVYTDFESFRDKVRERQNEENIIYR